MIKIVYHTSLDQHHYTETNICEIRSITKGNDLWKIEYWRDDGYRDYWWAGLDASEVKDGVADSVEIAGTVYEGKAGMTKLATIPVDMLNRLEETYRALEDIPDGQDI